MDDVDDDAIIEGGGVMAGRLTLGKFSSVIGWSIGKFSSVIGWSIGKFRSVIGWPTGGGGGLTTPAADWFSKPGGGFSSCPGRFAKSPLVGGAPGCNGASPPPTTEGGGAADDVIVGNETTGGIGDELLTLPEVAGTCGPETEMPIMLSGAYVMQMGTRKAWLQLLTRGSYRVP